MRLEWSRNGLLDFIFLNIKLLVLCLSTILFILRQNRKRSLTAIGIIAKRIIEVARSVIEYDDVVDGYFDKIKSMLIEKFSKPETDGEYALDLLMITKYYERIADHAVNIAGWVLFSITGLMEGVK